MRTLPLGPPRSTSRKIVLFVPRPWYRRCRRHNRQATPLTCLACMITQDVSALPTSNPHGGPITHRSTGSKPDSPVQPLFPKLFLASGLVCNSRTAVPSDLFWYQTQYLFSLPWTPFTCWLGIEHLPIRLKLLMVPPYFALDIFLRFNSRVTSATFLDVIDQIVNLVEVCPFEATPLFFRKYDGTPPPQRKDVDFILMTWSRKMKTSI